MGLILKFKEILTADGCLAQLVFFVIVLVCIFSYPPYGLFLGIGILFIKSRLSKKRKLEKQKADIEQIQKEMLDEERINKRVDERDKVINTMIKKGNIDKNFIKTQFADLIPSDMYPSEEEKDNLIEEHTRRLLKGLAYEERELRRHEVNTFLARSYLQRGKIQTLKNNLKQIDDLLKLTPVEFEKWVRKNIFEKEGWNVAETKVTGDGGIDLVLNRKDEHSIAQCKRFKQTVGEPFIRDFYGTMISEGVSRGYCVTTGLFSLSALKFAENKPIEMIDRRVLAQKYL